MNETSGRFSLHFTHDIFVNFNIMMFDYLQGVYSSSVDTYTYTCAPYCLLCGINITSNRETAISGGAIKSWQQRHVKFRYSASRRVVIS